MRPTKTTLVGPLCSSLSSAMRGQPLPDQPTPFEKAVGLYSAKDRSVAEKALGEITRSDPSNDLTYIRKT
jgi:hypothetical protein